MMRTSPMTTKMVAALIIAIINQYYNHTGYTIIEFKFIAKENNSKKIVRVRNPGDGGSA